MTLVRKRLISYHYQLFGQYPVLNLEKRIQGNIRNSFNNTNLVMYEKYCTSVIFPSVEKAKFVPVAAVRILSFSLNLEKIIQGINDLLKHYRIRYVLFLTWSWKVLYVTNFSQIFLINNQVASHATSYFWNRRPWNKTESLNSHKEHQIKRWSMNGIMDGVWW